MKPIPPWSLNGMLSRGYRLNIPAGTATRFEPGQEREVEMVEEAGDKKIYGFNAKIMGQR